MAGGLTVVHAVVKERSVLLAAASELHPDVVILDAAAVPTEVGDAVREILTLSPDTVIIVTASASSASGLSRAVVAGARGFLLKPYLPEELVATALDALATARAARDTRKAAAGETAPDRGNLIVVYGPKGGVGTTTIASHLAATLAARPNTRVGIIDLDLQFGDLGVLFDLKSDNSVVDLAEREGALDDGIVGEVFAKHSSGVRVLLAPEGIGAAMNIDPSRVARLLNELRPHFDHLVCDTWSALDELSTAALMAADRTVLVTTPELHSLRSLQRVLNEHPSLRGEPRNLVVLNRFPTRGALDRREVERGLGRGVSVAVPSRGVEMTRSVNEGLTRESLSDPVMSQAMARLSELIMWGRGERQDAAPPAAAPAERSRARSSF